MIYGYARVSTISQSLEEQVNELTQKANIPLKNIYREKYTGTTTKRPEFSKLLKQLKSGDTLYVTKLDRFARNTREALNAVEPLLNNGIKISVLNLGTIENTPMGKMILRTLLSVAEMERDLIVERSREGKEFAKKNNPNFHEGRPKRKITPHYQAIYEYTQNHSYSETAQAFNVSKSTVYRISRQIKNGH
ncbi:recombinase family protein [Ligilactobacillus aviarius]|uniref:recombinase family protein n=1 Tax=Ligilactobacillus aviarius TaxID=1606 RepID=UPI0024BAB625|nr:recombinase family protein [Ligilactobacillus aviarius]